MHTIALTITTAVFASAASADPITFIHTGSGSGVIGGLTFSDLDFIITAVGDTDDRVVLPNPATGWAIEHASANIEIVGLGTFGFNIATRTFLNTDLNTVGFSRSELGGLEGSDLYNGPMGNPVFDGWEMLTSIGPIIDSDFRIFQFFNGIETSGGILDFTDQQSVSGTFTATVVPAPTAFALLSLSGLAATRRRR